ncbi:uncharacterized protein DEA37_0013417, partial [Paragonimus westermani]
IRGPLCRCVSSSHSYPNANDIFLLQKGIAFANEATAKDKDGELAEALPLYERAIDYLLHASKYEAPDPKVKTTLRDKCASYLTRAEKIKKLLIEKKTKVIDIFSLGFIRCF